MNSILICIISDCKSEPTVINTCMLILDLLSELSECILTPMIFHMIQLTPYHVPANLARLTLPCNLPQIFERIKIQDSNLFWSEHFHTLNW